MSGFKEFDSDLAQTEITAKPREERARIRREAEKRVYTIAGTVLAAVLVVTLTTVFIVRGVTRKNNAQVTSTASGVSEDTLKQIAETPVVLAATVKDVMAAEQKTEVDDEIDKLLSEMTLEEKVAGLFLITPEQLTGAENVTGAGDMTRDALAQYAVGGLYYSEKNLKTAEQAKEMLSGVKALSKYPLFLAINENGTKRAAAAHVFNESVVESGSALQTAADGREAGESVGVYLSVNGLNFNLAPVANLLGADEDALAGFAYAKEAETAAAVTGAVVEGLQATGVSACVKYFPFYGTETDKSKEEMYANEFEPFRAAFDAGCDAVMVSTGKAGALTGTDEPCAFSSAVVTDLLRLELGFDGIVVTDALNTEAVTTRFDATEAVVKALDAGCDMFFMPLDFQASYEGLLHAVQDGTIKEERLEESLHRIYRVKMRETFR